MSVLETASDMDRVVARTEACASPDLSAIETPAALVDVSVMCANIRRVSDYCTAHGMDWRPHAKTHKSPVVAQAVQHAGAIGVTVATAREAEALAPVCRDILIAYPLLGQSKLNRVIQLDPFPGRLTIAVDSLVALGEVAEAARSAGRDVGVLIELDVGMKRTGVPTIEEAVALAAEASNKTGVRYDGVMFYPGHIRSHIDAQEEAVRDVRAYLVSVREALDGAGLAPRVVSGGATPTVWRSHEMGVTEVRAGTIVFNDRTTVLAGACDWHDCAYSVLATVISTAVSGQAVIDAGSKALSKEELRAAGGGYGVVHDRRDIIVKALSEEHGVLDLSATAWRPAIGERVRIIPNHVCVSMNLHETVWAMLGDEVVGCWPVAARGRAVQRPRSV